MDINDLSSKIIQASINVHRELGPGLLESVYHSCMVLELNNLELKVESELALPVSFRNQIVSKDGLRIDLLVEDKVIVELKSVEKIIPLHKKQLLTYLRLAEKPLGLLINFNEIMLKNGITRIINS
jgi:GxxExxY protein